MFRKEKRIPSSCLNIRHLAFSHLILSSYPTLCHFLLRPLQTAFCTKLCRFLSYLYLIFQFKGKLFICLFLIDNYFFYFSFFLINLIFYVHTYFISRWFLNSNYLLNFNHKLKYFYLGILHSDFAFVVFIVRLSKTDSSLYCDFVFNVDLLFH